MIYPCTCSHQFQDSFYGKGRRVFNLCKKETAIRCTVCKKEITLSNAKIKEIKTK